MQPVRSQYELGVLFSELSKMWQFYKVNIGK